jgi:hypothetical protein
MLLACSFHDQLKRRKRRRTTTNGRDAMNCKFVPIALVVTALSAALAASAAHAACGNRPGTPNEVKAEPLASSPQSAIRFSWRNTTGKAHDTPHSMHFDISVRDGRGNQVGKDMTGTGPFGPFAYGHRSHQDFTGLGANQTLCFKIRARTGRGTSGCVSQAFSAQVCATTLATPPATPPSTRPGKPTNAPPVLVASRESGNVFYVRGFRFQANAPVTIRTVDGATLQGALITSIGGKRITASANSLMGVRLYGICSKAQGPISFSANDGRENPADKTGTLWSNTVTVACKR